MKKIFVTLLIGLLDAIIGAWKDYPYEGFRLVSFLRSPLLALLWFPILNKAASPLICALATLAYVRLSNEIWKLIILQRERNDFKIPQILHWNKKPVKNIPIRLFLFSFAILAMVLLPSLFDLNVNKLHGIVLALLAGVYISLGGFYKDAPFEGFNARKFPRSALVGFLAGILMVQVTSKAWEVLLSSAGFERLIVESYKAFSRRKPGKFKKEITPKTSKKLELIFMVSYLVTLFLFLIANI